MKSEPIKRLTWWPSCVRANGRAFPSATALLDFFCVFWGEIHSGKSAEMTSFVNSSTRFLPWIWQLACSRCGHRRCVGDYGVQGCLHPWQTLQGWGMGQLPLWFSRNMRTRRPIILRSRWKVHQSWGRLLSWLRIGKMVRTTAVSIRDPNRS